MKIILTNFFTPVILIILIFQNTLQNLFTPFKYTDEILGVLFLGLITFCIFQGMKIQKREIIYLLLILSCLVLGMLGNYIFKYQTSLFIVFSDFISTFKMFFIWIGARYFLNLFSVRDLKRTVNILVPICNVYSLLMLTYAVLNVFVDVNMSYDIRYGIRSFAFFYGTPGLVINQVSYFILLLVAKEKYFKRSQIPMLIVNSFIVLLTLRSRGIVLILVFWVLYYYFIFLKKKSIKKSLIPIVLVSLYAGYSQFVHYFLEGVTPRQRFVVGAVQIVKEHLPLGSGFATWGSSAAADNYSVLYYQYGISQAWGMSPDLKLFLNDNYWPMIFAQFGIIGAVLFSSLFVFLIYDITKQIKFNSYSRLIGYFYIIDVVFGSVQSSYPAHYSIVTLTLLLAMFFTNFNNSSVYRKTI